MSKNVRIDNETTQRVFNGIDKIRTNEVGGGTIDWIPQGEYKDHINKGTLEISQNGTYFPSDYGYDSFSEVTVQFGDGLGQTELDDGTGEDTGIEYELPLDPVDIVPDVLNPDSPDYDPDITTPIYDPEVLNPDSPIYNPDVLNPNSPDYNPDIMNPEYDPDILNPESPEYNPDVLDPESPDYIPDILNPPEAPNYDPNLPNVTPQTPNITYTDKDVDEYYPVADYDPVDPVDVPTEIPDAPVDTITTNTYKGPGTITGIDPETGEPTTISTDSEGRIRKEMIPASFSVVIPPGVSTIYYEGSAINFNQYTYVAFRGSGAAYPINEGEPIPNLIPFSELEFPVTIATKSSSGSGHTSGGF